MPKKPLKILGINPGKRYLGIALFEGGELLDWGVKVIKGKWSKRKMEKAIGIVSELIRQYQPDAVAMKKLHPSRTSRNLTRLADGIARLSRRKRLRLCRYSIGEFESFFSPDERVNRRRLAELVASAYPVLCHELEREKSHKNPYHIRMFEAVALGSMCFHHLDK